MAILATKETRVIVQGITGREASFHTAKMIEYGTQIVGGVSPGKGGEWARGIPVFDSVRKAVDATGGNATIVYTPPADAIDAIYEAIEAHIELIVCITEGIPLFDMMKVCHYAASANSRVIGPNCPGLLNPGQTKIGVIPGSIGQLGNIGVISKSGTLLYEAVLALNQAGLGQTTCVGIGSAPVVGTSFADVLAMFEEDPETEKIVLIGEPGGQMEIQAAEFIKSTLTKPVVAFVAGKSISLDKWIDYSDINMSGSGAADKIDALLAAGALVADTLEQIPTLLTQPDL